MRLLRNRSIQKKITAVVMVVTAAALVLVGLLFLVIDLSRLQGSLLSEVRTVASIVGGNSKAALEFDDAAAATQNLSVLVEDPRVTAARLYSDENELFAAFESAGARDYPHHKILDFSREQQWAKGRFVSVFQPILHKGKRIGGIWVLAAFSDMEKRLLEHLLIVLGVIAIAAFAAYLLSGRLRDLIALPILHLAETAREISEKGDYSLRASKETEDEMGQLVDRFNQMLDEISRQNTEIRKNEELLKVLNEQLEQKVLERTRELRESQELLRRSERLASIGTLAEGLAHEIRNPLNSILLATQFATRNKSTVEGPLKEVFESITREAKRCAAIIKNVLLFSRTEPTEKRPSDINSVIKAAVRSSTSTVRVGEVEIKLALAPELPSVRLNPTEMEQVFINLIINAIEATSGQVTITVSTKASDERVVCVVEDNGPGVSEEVVKHIFDPFYSTKRHKGNTGLGLSLCYGIVTDHGGSMRVRSALGVGTTFIIELPLRSLEAHEEEESMKGKDQEK